MCGVGHINGKGARADTGEKAMASERSPSEYLAELAQDMFMLKLMTEESKPTQAQIASIHGVEQSVAAAKFLTDKQAKEVAKLKESLSALASTKSAGGGDEEALRKQLAAANQRAATAEEALAIAKHNATVAEEKRSQALQSLSAIQEGSKVISFDRETVDLEWKFHAYTWIQKLIENDKNEVFLGILKDLDTYNDPGSTAYANSEARGSLKPAGGKVTTKPAMIAYITERKEEIQTKQAGK